MNDFVVKLRRTFTEYEGEEWRADVEIVAGEYGHAAVGKSPQQALAALAVYWATQSGYDQKVVK